MTSDYERRNSSPRFPTLAEAAQRRADRRAAMILWAVIVAALALAYFGSR